MTFYSPLAFIFLLTIPLIIVLYLLKQRHRDYSVSSLYLWREVLKDIEANAPWQKLKKNLLMALQIIAMILLTLALSRPFLNNAGSNPTGAVIVIDTSISMQATDIKPSRFEEAKKQAIDYASNLKPGTLVTLISMGNNAIIEENLSKDKDSLIKAIKSLKVTNGASNPENATALVQSIVKQQPDTEVIILSDGIVNIPGIKVIAPSLSKSTGNFAIMLFSYSPTKDGLTALSRIANFTGSDAVIPVSLYVGGRVFDARNVTVKAGETANVYWEGIPAQALQLECRIDTEDSLSADNTAWAAVNPVKKSRVMLVTESNIFIEKLISLMNGMELFKTSLDKASELRGYDLYIYDGFLPDKLPKDGNIMVFNPPQNTFFEVGKEIALPEVIQTEHPILKNVNTGVFSIGKTKILPVPLWGEPILETGEGAIAFSGSKDGRKFMVFGFDLHNTDIVLRPAFPIFMNNTFEVLISSRIKNTENIFPGEGIEFNLNPKAEEVKVKTPSGETVSLAPPFPAGVFDKTGETGQYILDQKIPGGYSHHYFTVNVPAEKESNLLAAKIHTAGSGDNKPAASGKINSGLNLQALFLWSVLVLLLVEWWVYTNGI